MFVEEMPPKTKKEKVFFAVLFSVLLAFKEKQKADAKAAKAFVDAQKKK